MIRFIAGLLLMVMLPLCGMKNECKNIIDGVTLSKEKKELKLKSMLTYWKIELKQRHSKNNNKSLQRSFSELTRSRSTSPNKDKETKSKTN